MKKYLLVTSLFCLANLFAQNKVAEKVSELQGLKASFRPISVLTVTPNTINSDVNKVVDGATLATIKFEKNNEIVANQYETIELEIPYQNQNILVLLYKVNPFLEGFHVDTMYLKRQLHRARLDLYLLIDQHQNKSGNVVNSTRCVSFYFEIDNNIYIQNGSNTTTTSNWMTSLFNNIQTLFDNDGISTGLKSIFIWTDADPYEGVGTSSGTIPIN